VYVSYILGYKCIQALLLLEASHIQNGLQEVFTAEPGDLLAEWGREKVVVGYYEGDLAKECSVFLVAFLVFLA
jgi:hypothetical protein